MSRPRTTFAGGKRVSVNPATRMCSVEGEHHIDRYSFDAAPGRVRLYETLADLRKRKRRDVDGDKGTYQGALAAARAAVQLIEEVAGS